MKALVGLAAGLILAFAVHEAAHMLAFRAYGIGVDEYRIMWGPEVASVELGETKYSFGCLPIGAYVMPSFEGHYTEEELAEIEARNPVRGAMLADPERRAEVLPPQKEFVVLIVGPLSNFVLAGLIFFVWLRVRGRSRLKDASFLVAGVEPGSRAASAGLEAGDLITGINGRPLVDYVQHELPDLAAAQSLDVRRGADEVHIAGIPAPTKPDELLGVRTGYSSTYVAERITARQSLVTALQWIWNGSLQELKGIARYFKPKRKKRRNSHGIMPWDGTMNDSVFWAIFAYISLGLGVFNLLVPVPPLDGGKLWFAIYESFGGTVSETVELYTTLIGFAAIVFIFWLRPLLSLLLRGLWSLVLLIWRKARS